VSAVRTSATTPSGHGEVLTEPVFASWAALARANASAAAAWDFEVCGVPAVELRARARAEAVAAAKEFSSRMGVPVSSPPRSPDLLVMTGHQPQLYHPGIWITDFLLQRLADETGGAAIDLVVDSDGFDLVEVHAPCLRPELARCAQFLAVGGTDTCFACSPVPGERDLATFREAGAQMLATLPAPAIGRHFQLFCDAMDAVRADSSDLAEFITFARRRYEAPAGTDYLELPVTTESRTAAFSVFLADIVRDAPRFADAYNTELAAYRERTGTRSAAQPFPDLRVEEGMVELPFWHLRDSGRSTLWARTGGVPALVCDGEVLCELPSECEEAAGALASCAVRPAPKALALTLYNRMFVADLFIHGTGGGRYDRVTDGVIRAFWGVEPPEFVVASMTMYLPLGARVVTAEEVDAVTQTINRLQHNPDQLLDEIEFDDAGEHRRAQALADEKSRLVGDIASPDADKKDIGRRIREVNAELSALMEPYEKTLREQRDRLMEMQQASEILTDRTYPFCFWSPLEVADKAR
jgi:hypothetical protein